MLVALAEVCSQKVPSQWSRLIGLMCEKHATCDSAAEVVAVSVGVYGKTVMLSGLANFKPRMNKKRRHATLRIAGPEHNEARELHDTQSRLIGTSWVTLW